MAASTTLASSTTTISVTSTLRKSPWGWMKESARLPEGRGVSGWYWRANMGRSSPSEPTTRLRGWRVLAPDGSELGSHTLLHDHANCELKAASTALGLIYRYPERLNLAAEHIVGFVNIESAEVLDAAGKRMLRLSEFTS